MDKRSPKFCGLVLGAAHDEYAFLIVGKAPIDDKIGAGKRYTFMCRPKHLLKQNRRKSVQANNALVVVRRSTQLDG